eukprot:SAG11_NODE_5828_length_1454_cov_2.002214_2_plen_71_part_00
MPHTNTDKQTNVNCSKWTPGQVRRVGPIQDAVGDHADQAADSLPERTDRCHGLILVLQRMVKPTDLIAQL